MCRCTAFFPFQGGLGVGIVQDMEHSDSKTASLFHLLLRQLQQCVEFTRIATALFPVIGVVPTLVDWLGEEP